MGRQQEEKFVHLVHRLRTLGWLLGALPLAVVMRDLQVSAWSWGLLAANALVWPHLARVSALRAVRPGRAEFVNLHLDAAMIGGWIAVIQFNLLPSIVLVATTAMDRISAGGWKLGVRTLALQLLASAGVAALNGFALQPESTMPDILACIPLLLIYPVWLSTENYRLARHVNRQNRELERLNRIDALTGLASRRHLLESVELEMLRFRRARRATALVLLDIDRFKQVNDTQGHSAGDALLQALAQLLRQCVRQTDLPGRLGGDEFCIVLPETSRHGARVVAERIRAQCEATLRAADSGVTVSLGIAEIDPEYATVEDWLNAADAALYHAKENGRNRVGEVVWEPAGGAPAGAD